MTSPRIALVTGANQGLGLALVQGLADRLDPTDRVLLTGRDRGRVDRAVAALGPRHATVEGHVLDVRDAGAIAALAGSLGAVDIVISNAAARMAPDRTPAEMIDAVVETNNLATTRMLRAFLPILRPGGRMLVVASSFGTLDRLPADIRARFADARTLDDVDAAVAAWRAAVRDGRAVAEGWPEWINIPSKVAQVAAVRAAATPRRARDLADGTLLAAVCPGLIDTDASRPWFDDMRSAQTPAQAAGPILDLAFDPRFHGELVQFGRVLPWEPATALR
jgi:carbonyl reductase 1